MRTRLSLALPLLVFAIFLVDSRTAEAQQRTFTFVNKCSQTVWVGSLGNPGSSPINQGGWQLNAGASQSYAVPAGWAGRFWGRRNCNFDGNGLGSCETGDCGNKLRCNGAGGKPPTTLAEFTLNGWASLDYYDLSLVDGYDFPMSIVPSPATTNPNNKYQCGSPTCVSDLLATCPGPLQKKNGQGQVIACMSACEAFNTDQYCCRGAFNTPETCKSSTWPVNYPAIFKQACPDAYSYAYDDVSSTYTCNNPHPNYTITFCPSGGGGPGNPDPGGPPNAANWYQIINQTSTKCLDETGWSQANGTQVQQYGCGPGQFNQQWQVVPTSDGYSRVSPRHAPWLALDVTGVSTGTGAKMQLWGYGGGNNQQFRVESVGGGYYRLVARHSGLCLDVPSSSVDNGVQLQQWTCNGTGAQRFRFNQQ